MGQYAQVGTRYEVGLRELGEAIVRETFRDAAKVFLHLTTNGREAQAVQESVLFLRGSGLEAVVERFGLPFHLSSLRGTFEWKLHQLASSSATTLDGHSCKGASPVWEAPRA